MSTETVVRVTVVDVEEDYEEESFCPLGNCLSVDKFYGFLPLSGSGDIVKISSTQLTRSNYWVEAVLTSSE